MDENKFLGEPSSSVKDEKSLTNNNNNNNNDNNNNNNSHSNATNNSNSSISNNNSNSNKDQHRPSSSNSSQLRQNQDDDTSDADDDIDSWECSLCTFQNSADKFKCEMCDLRRGTSTRKPRCNADTIVAQVVKQQEQIRQQTVVKPPKTRPSNASNSHAAATSSNDPNLKTKAKPRTQDKGRKRPGNDRSDDDESGSEDLNSPKPKRKRFGAAKSRKRDSRSTSRHNKRDGPENEDESTDSDSTDVSNLTDFNAESPQYSSLTDSPEPAASSPAQADKTSDGTFEPTPMEVNGNLIKYSPPTSSGRTGLIIDKKRFTQHSVTVNDVTITFTEFATRQNRYVRKKKRSKSRPKPPNNNGSDGAGDH